MNEQFADLGEITLCYETFGDPADPTLLLIMGLGTQMIAWHEDFCGSLADAGFHVVRFDNRDSGRSTHVKGRPPTLTQLALRRSSGARYTLEDMAGDAVGLLTHLGVERAHVVGASMGGMIAQTVAIRHPERVLSLVSIMSNTGARLSGQPAFAVYPLMVRAAPAEREKFAEHIANLYAKIGSPGFDRDPEEVLAMARLAWDRDHDRAASGRQLGAIVTAPDRGGDLGRIQAPTLVIHGKSDKLVRPSGGRTTASRVPGARLLSRACTRSPACPWWAWSAAVSWRG